MKTTIISKSILAIALTISLASFTSDKKEAMEKTEAARRAGFAASIFQLANTSKVKLAVNKAEDARLHVTLRDLNGKIYYDENNKTNQYRRVFDLTDMSDGTYYFELNYMNHKLTKEVQLKTNDAKVITFN